VCSACTCVYALTYGVHICMPNFSVLICSVLVYSLKMECEKLAQEKTEMQRHYVMVNENLYYLPE